MRHSASECEGSFVAGLFSTVFALLSLGLMVASFGFCRLVGGFWTTISDCFGFMGLKVKAVGSLLVSFLLGGIRVKNFHYACGGFKRSFTMRFSGLD